MKENTIIAIQEFTLAPLSEIEGGSSEERDKYLKEWFDKVVMKDDRLLSQMMLNHYWSGTSGGPGGTPVLIVSEFYLVSKETITANLAKLSFTTVCKY